MIDLLLFNKRFIFKVFLTYLIVFYPLLFQVFINNSFASTVNQGILFILISLTILTYLNKIIAYFYSNDYNISSLFLVLFIYLNISLLYFTAFDGNINISSVLRELLYTIVPILFYFLGKVISHKERNIFFTYFLFCFFLVVMIGYMYRLNLYLPEFLLRVFEQKLFKFNFSSYYTPIIMGYLAQLTFALLLYKKINIKFSNLFIIIFFFTSVFTLQRAAWLGLIISILIYAIKSFSFSKILITAIIVVLGSSLIYRVVSSNIKDHDESMVFSPRFFIAEIEGFKISEVQSTRENQAIITNSNNIFNILFGEGFGKYSPSNELTKLKMPDACYYRIYNEIGIFGFLLFFFPFIYFVSKAIIIKDYFMIYFISFSLIAFYFNRVIWTIPISYLFYTFLGVFSNFNNQIDE